MPQLSKKRRYAKSAISLVGRDIRSGLFTTLKAATLIVIEDEIENELFKNGKLFWMENGKKKLLPKSRGTSLMISGFMCPCHGFMSACIRGETHKSYKTFEAGKGREGWFTNKDLND